MEVLTVAEAAEMLRVSSATIIRYVRAGKLEAYQAAPGCAVRILAASVEALRKEKS